MSSALIFYILTGIIIVAGWRMVVTKNLIHSVLSAFAILASTAGLFFLLKANFVAVAQILIYAGAVTILVLFVVMLTHAIHEKIVGGKLQGTAVVFILAFLSLLLWVVSSVKWPLKRGILPLDITRFLAKEIFLEYLLPFEIASLVLLVAIIGAVTLAGKD